ncbi:DUF3710 domain-containing protein [Corynebacterium halotolerans]|uniref:DUF3710 domain-containing protein n=1 Tax=Corynebacterium halotolerans YIM 70093 = DSM 44683 TaxID=1121362 RepID=M1NYR5_9CORY|nr:DUF3710 domain-containing protein [Corynebacterium halotolerans]AGF72645.1 hypothetical protein A605_08215 [Corynebacterium halotolerans YIM 70093 = DSM 44683]
MALWPFGKKKDDEAAEAAETADAAGRDVPAPAPGAAPADSPADAAAASTAAPAPGTGPDDEPDPVHDAVNGSTGPFDGDSVDIADFDFSDFASGVLNLGSMQIPLPKESQVQVEMGEQGPKMLHIVTRHGRITPVAFAAPTSAGQWREASQEIAEGMSRDGMTVRIDRGPWGREVVGEGPAGIIRIIGAEGPRWMLRMTLAAPADRAEELAALGREVTARTFVYRGDNPVLAGNSLPVALPQQLVDQVQQAMQQRARQQGQGNQPQPGAAQQNRQDQQAVDEASQALRDLGGATPPDKPTEK